MLGNVKTQNLRTALRCVSLKRDLKLASGWLCKNLGQC